MGVPTSEILGANPGEVAKVPTRKIQLPDPNKGAWGGVKAAGWTVRFAGNRVKDTLRFARKYKGPLAAFVVGLALRSPHSTVNFSKNVIDKSADTYSDPKGTAGSVTNATEQALMDATDAAISKAKQGIEAGGEKIGITFGAKRHEKKEQGLPSIEKEIDYFYPGTEGADRQKLYSEIEITRAYMESILTPDSYQNLKDNLQIFDNINSFTGISQSAIAGWVCAESRAGVDGGLEEGVAAEILAEKPLGPVQLSGGFGRDQKLDVTGDTDDQRLEWDQALPAGAKEIYDTSVYFAGPDNKQGIGLGFWRMHMGRDGIKHLIESYSANHGLSFTNLPDFINEQKITAFKILEIKNIREELEQPGYDKTPIYVLRIAACASKFDELEPEWRKELKDKISTVADTSKIVQFPQQKKEAA